MAVKSSLSRMALLKYFFYRWKHTFNTHLTIASVIMVTLEMS
jgi:hypothetical protein